MTSAPALYANMGSAGHTHPSDSVHQMAVLTNHLHNESSTSICWRLGKLLPLRVPPYSVAGGDDAIAAQSGRPHTAEARRYTSCGPLTKTMIHGMTHGRQIPDERLRIVTGAANVARGVRSPCQGIHWRLMPLQLSHWQRRIPAWSPALRIPWEATHEAHYSAKSSWTFLTHNVL